MKFVWGDNPFISTEGIRDLDPQIIGERIEFLLSTHGDKLTPEVLVQDAQNAESPLNPIFAEHVSSKAHKWDLNIARNVMSSLRVIFVNSSGDEDTKYALMSVRNEDDGRKREYRHINMVESDDKVRESVTRDVISQLKSINNRYSYLKSITPLTRAIDEMEEMDEDGNE